MKAEDLRLIGICRFSMLGRGDWKLYRDKPDHQLEELYELKAAELFDARRMDNRLATFEHLTLASIKHQTDEDFIFLVVSSDRMPDHYRKRLENICKPVPQVRLKFVSPMHISEALKTELKELDLDMKDVVQFRLDDDDCVAKDYVRRLRRHSAALWRNRRFAISFPSIYYCISDGPTAGSYQWFSPFFSAGTAVRHNDRTIYDFAHYKMPQSLLSVTDPAYPCIVTHAGDNDTPRHPAHILSKRGMVRADLEKLEADIHNHFSYLTDQGLDLAFFRS